MKILAQNKALKILGKLKSDYRIAIQTFESKAKNCQNCETKGACCLDEHFVNVKITRLEAVAMREILSELPKTKQSEIRKKISTTVEKYRLMEDSLEKTFACPLFEKESGCLVHAVKPVPCIQHACYERREDLPPDDLQNEIEQKIEKLNQKTYGQSSMWLSLPLQLKKNFEK